MRLSNTSLPLQSSIGKHMATKTISDFSSNLDRLSRLGAVIFFVAMLVLVIFQVISRYIFRSVPVWSEEAARYCMVWGGLLGATVAFYLDEDPKLLKPPTNGRRLWIALASLLRTLAILIFLGPVFYYSGHFLMRHWQRTAEGLGISTFWVTLAVPFSVGVILTHAIAKISWKGAFRQNYPSDDGSSNSSDDS